MAAGVWIGVYSKVFRVSRQLLLTNKHFGSSIPSMRKEAKREQAQNLCIGA